MSKEGKLRAQRSANFTKEETELLVKLVLKRKHIIECKLTDGQTTATKNKAWDNVTIEFNAMCPRVARTGKVLREKYNGIKRVMRKTAANLRAQRMATGGGKAPEEEPPKSEVFAELCETIAVSVGGLSASVGDDDYVDATDKQYSKFVDEYLLDIDRNETIDQSMGQSYGSDVAFHEIGDSGQENEKNNSDGGTDICNGDLTMPLDVDAAPPQPTSKPQTVLESEPPKSKLVNDWGKYNPAMLRAPISSALKRAKKTNRFVSDGESVSDTKKKILKRDAEMVEEKHQIEVENLKLEQDERKQRLANQVLKKEMYINKMKYENEFHVARMQALKHQLSKGLLNHSTTD